MVTSTTSPPASSQPPEMSQTPSRQPKRRPVPSTPLDKKSMEYVVRSGIAGGVAGCAAKTLIAPLDRIKILFQTSNPHYKRYSGSMVGLVRAMQHIWLVDGVRGFFQGHSATLIRIFPYSAVKFIAYEQIRNILIPTKTYETHVRRFASGSLAGLCSVFVTYPLDVIRVRLAYTTDQENVRLTDIIKEMYREAPSKTLVERSFIPNWFAHWCNFYRGYTPTVLGMIPYAGVSFFAHDLVHDILCHPAFAKYSVLPLSEDAKRQMKEKNQRVPLKTWAELVSGGLAGMLSQTASYPFEIIRRRLQVSAVSFKFNEEHKFIGIGEMAKVIYKERGWRGFFVGLSIGYIKVAPMVACSFFVYERMKYYMGI